MFGKTGSGANIGKLKKDVAAGTRDVDSVSVLILELDAPPPTSGYAVRTVNHRQQVGQNEWKVIDDWTPGQTASAASRHYITAGGNELQELANYLAVVCPRIKRLLTGKEEEAGEPTNTLTLTSSGATGQSMLPDLRFDSAKGLPRRFYLPLRRHSLRLQPPRRRGRARRTRKGQCGSAWMLSTQRSAALA